MNRVGGKTANCDAPDCRETIVVLKGEDPTWVLEWANWRVDGEDTYCPEHTNWKVLAGLSIALI